MTRELELYSPAARNSIRSKAGTRPEETRKVRMRSVIGQVLDEEFQKIMVLNKIAQRMRAVRLTVKPMP